MPKKKLLPPPPARKPRADAKRNRERILEIAKDAFTRDGATASLDDIARRSGVGNATLYRHFPTRDDLIEAVYRNEVERLAAAEQRFAATMPPIEALRAWMLLFIDHVSEKKLIISVMDTVPGGSMRLMEGSRSLIHGTFVTSVQRAIASGGVAVASVIKYPGNDADAAAIRAMQDRFTGEVGISAWNGLVVARLVATDGAALRRDLVAVLSALDAAPLPRLWLN